jgi:hypothetical protein
VQLGRRRRADALKPPFQLVVVEWEDASNIGGWGDLEQAQRFESDFDYHCTNIGYLIRDDAECVIVAARASGDFGAVGLVERIPRGMVQRVIPLRR